MATSDATLTAYRLRMRKLELQVEWLAASAAARSGHTAEEHILLAQGYAEDVIKREEAKSDED